MAPYRPPGRSNRSGRTQDNEVFEGLPVKQWGHSTARISLAPPASETANAQDDKWGEPPMPRDSHLLHPYTQHLLRLARSGRTFGKRKQDTDLDDDKPEDEAAEETKTTLDERNYVAKKWKPVPEHQLEPEHKHFVFLAKRRKGLQGLYGPEQQAGAPVPLRKTKVRKTDANGEVAIYEVLVPEGQVIEDEVTEAVELPEVKPLAAGTVIEGVGVANEEGVVVAEHLRPAAPRRNRPPPKKKGGPGRGKKRVTFTNPDGSTYTKIVPNATKLVPEAGQTMKHVAKGEEAAADVTAEQAAAHAAANQDGEEEGSGSDDGEEGDEDDDDREEGEFSQDEELTTAAATPAPEQKKPASSDADVVMDEDSKPAPPEVKVEPAQSVQPVEPTVEGPVEPVATDDPPAPDGSSSPELPLAHNTAQSESAPPTETAPAVAETTEPETMELDDTEKFDDGDEDLLGNLEKHLGGPEAES